MAVRGFAKERDRCEGRSPDLTVWSKVPVEKPVDPRLLNIFSTCIESEGYYHVNKSPQLYTS
jgi:hypothetical protein